MGTDFDALLDWDADRIEEIRASGRLTDLQNEQLLAIREHGEAYKRAIGELGLANKAAAVELAATNRAWKRRVRG